ncbi:Gfo/Idh/MocA family oxidoreductase [bacterium]|nr:Gfo/Idh/MocA family oxidoreductase [bacterium]
MKEKLGIGIVGLGGFAQGRLNSIKNNQKAKLIAVLTRNGRENYVKEILNNKGVSAEIETDENKFFSRKDIYAVIISVPNLLHYKFAKMSILSGKHTLVEYPMTQTLKEYDELVNLAKEKKVVLHHALTVLQEPLFISMKKNKERVGEVIYSHIRYFGGKKWYVNSSLRGDPFVALHIHFLYQFYILFGEFHVLSSTLKEKDKEYVFGSIFLKLKQNATGIIDFGMGLEGPSYFWVIVGEKGFLLFDSEKGNQIFFNKERIPLEEKRIDDTENFIEQIVSGAEPHITLEESRKAIEISLNISKILKNDT